MPAQAFFDHDHSMAQAKKTAAAKPRTASDSTVTMEDVARVAGVSTITVSRALRDSPLVTEQTREKIRKIAAEQGYRFNISARNLRMRRSYSVAVVVEMTPVKGRPMSDPYPLELLGGITQELTTAGYSVVLTSRQLLDTAPVQGADGLIDALSGRATVHILPPKGFTFGASFDWVTSLLKKKAGHNCDGLFAASD